MNTSAGLVVFTVDIDPNRFHDPRRIAAGNANVMVSDTFHVKDTAGRDDPFGYQRQLLGLDAEGRVLYNFLGSLTARTDLYGVSEEQMRLAMMASIPNKLLRKIKTLQLDARPFYWAEFRNVAVWRR